jgi:hypothetical protein
MKRPQHTYITLTLATTLLASCASTPGNKHVSGQLDDTAYERSLRRDEFERNLDEAMFWQDVSRPNPIHLSR